jgi:hypothetical protein
MSKLKGRIQMIKLLKLKRIYLLLLFPLSFLLIFIAKTSIFFAEQIYALHIYKWLSQIISLITGLVPISLAELLIIILPIVLIILLIKFIIRIYRDREARKVNLAKGLINVLCMVSVLLFLFTILAGLNYYRYPFSYYSNLEIDKYSLEELYDMTSQLAVQANDLRSSIPQVNEDGVFKLSMSKYKLAKEANKAMRKLSKEYPVFKGLYGSPKPILLSKLMSYTEITGIFIPFTMEANVNVDVPDYTIPFTMCHEMAHQRGFMREDEANYIGYLVGMSSDNVELMYSSTMYALVTSGNALYRQAPDLYFEIISSYSEGVVKDIRANINYWSKYEDNVISVISDKVNDTYLKANSQSDGVKSYGRMVDLLLAKYRADQAR